MAATDRAITALKTEGVFSVAWRTSKWLSNRYNSFRPKPLTTVYSEDLVAVDWSEPHDFNGRAMPKPDDGYRVAWIITPPGRTSGGHQNAFRFMSFIENSGHHLTIYLYAPGKYPRINLDEMKRMLRETSAYPELDAEFVMYDPALGLRENFDAVFASDWEAAYASYRVGGEAKRFYFTQDFEPAFFAAGSDYVAAENSYRFGFHGISAGRWLAQKLNVDYGMSCDYYDYGVDTGLYRHTNPEARNEVLFYARPPTPRRATEFGLLALHELHRMRPEITINLVGWDMSGYDVAFPYVNHSAVDIAKLNAIYNRCAAGLVLSLTNMSLLPMEVMAAGVVPVVNDADNTHGFFDSPHIDYVPMSPRTIAHRMVDIIDRPDQAEHAATIARSVAETDWSDPASSFIEQFEGVMTSGS